MGAIANFTFPNYLFRFFIGTLVTKFTKLINFVEVDSGLGLKDLTVMFLSFLSSMPSTNVSRKGEIRFSQKSLTNCIVAVFK